MPIMDGLETTELILSDIKNRRLDPLNLKESPYICCLSANSEQRYIT